MRKIKTFITIFLALCLMLSLASCAKRDPNVPDGFSLLENEGAEYRLVYPSEWVVERNDAGGMSVYVSETDFSNVSVTAFTPERESGAFASLQEYIENYYFAMFRENFSSLAVKENQDGTIKITPIKVAESEGAVVEYSAVFSGEDYSFKTCIVPFDGYLYHITYTAKTDAFDSHLAAVDTMIEHFQFK